MFQFACAKIIGNNNYPNLNGIARFYKDKRQGILIKLTVEGLPDECNEDKSGFFGLHIHEFGNCTLPFDKTGMHYNPEKAPHPNHKGDLPPLLSSHGNADMTVYVGKLCADEIIGKSIIIHSQPDDFTTQPSGNSGDKIGCGVIKKCI